jgi:TPR repeat protein
MNVVGRTFVEGVEVIGIAQNSICPFCNSDRRGKTDEEKLAEMMKRVEANDSGAIYLANNYYHGRGGLQQDEDKALELYARAAELGWSMAYYGLACIYHGRGDLKKAKFHFEAAAMAGHEIARFNLGCIEKGLGNMERAIKHLEIAASAGNYDAMQALRESFERGLVSRDAIDSTLTAYNNSCAEMRSEARDANIRRIIEIKNG